MVGAWECEKRELPGMFGVGVRHHAVVFESGKRIISMARFPIAASGIVCIRLGMKRDS